MRGNVSAGLSRGISALLLVGVGLMPGGCSRTQKPAPQQEVVVCSFGGSFQEAQRAAFFKPFEKETGIAVREASYGGEYEKIASQVRAGRVVWDLIDVEDAVLRRGAANHLWMKVPQSLQEKLHLLPGMGHPFGVAADVYATLMAYDSSRTQSAPPSWAGFWDVAAYPGGRALRRSPRGTLEFALLADGVPPSNLYPLDVERAFTSLERLRPHIVSWWETGQQPVQMLVSGAVTYSSAWSGRVWAAQRDGKTLTPVWNQGLLETEWWVVPRGAPHADVAWRLVQFCNRPDRQAEMSELFGVGFTNPEAGSHLPSDLLNRLPTSPDHLQELIPIDGEWWAVHEAEVEERWEAWLSR